jgi:hypothetical protein
MRPYSMFVYHLINLPNFKNFNVTQVALMKALWPKQWRCYYLYFCDHIEGLCSLLSTMVCRKFDKLKHSPGKKDKDDEVAESHDLRGVSGKK